MNKVALIDGRFRHGQTKKGVDLAFYELHRRGLLKKLSLPYEMILTMDPYIISSQSKWEGESQWLEYLSKQVALHYELGMKTVTVGGDHSVGLSTVVGVHKQNPNISLVWVDGHADFNTSESSMTGNLHGMPLNGLVNGWKSIDPIFKWIGEGIIKPEHVALIGLRDVDEKEQVLLDASGIYYRTMKDIRELGINRCLEQVTKAINPYNERDWHVSFDLDSIDPNEFPSTGCLVPGGITFEEALMIMKWFNFGWRKHLKSFDIVEWNPQIASGSDCDEKLIQLINAGL
jgi:arginase